LASFLKSLLLVALLTAASPVDAANISLRASAVSDVYRVVLVEGIIDTGDAKRLEQLLREAASAGDKPLAVWLESRGGDVDVSMQMGKIIRSHRATTFNGYCASACVYTFLGGMQRIAAFGEVARLNVHRPELAETYVEHPTTYGKSQLMILRDYIVGMTGSDDFFDMMLKIPYATPHALQLNEALALHVATSVVR